MQNAVHYTTARRMRYMQEIGLPMQIGAVIDELRALREQIGGTPAPSFAALVAIIDGIKQEIPKV
ncbi:MAG: hypothetical protein LLG15_11140 [Betaproteobacteria bacterium]|nr:hypothetical protein [Betaproteobacteria bacterium]